MSRARWLAPPDEQTDPEMAQAILDCQGDWWTWGSSICRQPDVCLFQRACYFVRQVLMPRVPRITWLKGFDPEPKQQLGLFEVAA